MQSPTVGFYRYLYDTVGADHVWWLRRTMPDRGAGDAAARSGGVDPRLCSGGQPAGFFELDGRGWPDVNLSYFGLLPHAIGAASVIRSCAARWTRLAAEPTRHDREHLYGRSSARTAHVSARGLSTLRQVREVWNVPLRLGMRIPSDC